MSRNLDKLDNNDITLWGLFAEAYSLTSRQLTEDLEEEIGVPAQWFEVLLRIGRTPGEALPMTQLAKAVTFSSGGFTKLADRMEAKGLIKRASCPGDRRSFLVTLTDEGRALLDKGIDAHLPSLRYQFTAAFTERERQQLERMLRRLRDRHSDEPDGSTHEAHPDHAAGGH